MAPQNLYKPKIIMAIIRRGKVKKKTTLGYKVVVVVGEDVPADEVNTVDVSIPAVADQPTPSPTTMTLPLKVTKANGNKRFVFKDLSFSDDAVNFSYSMTSTMKDAANKQVGDSVTSTIEVEDDGDNRVRSVSIRQLDETNFRLKVVVVGDNENNVAKVAVEFTDFSGPEPIPMDLVMENPTVNGGKKVFKYNTLTFEDPSAAVDEVYNMVVDLQNAEGASLGASEQNATVDSDLA